MKKNLNKIVSQGKNKDGKVVIKNFIHQSVFQLVNIGLPLIVLPYMIKTVGLDKYGLIAFAFALISYFISFIDYGFNTTATRDIAVSRHSLKQQSYIYSEAMIIRGIATVIASLIIAIVVFFVPSLQEVWLLYFYTALIFIGWWLFPEWFFYGWEDMGFVTYSNLAIKVFVAISVFLFIHNPQDYILYPLLMSLGYIIAGVVGQIIVYKKYRISFLYIKRVSILAKIRYNAMQMTNDTIRGFYDNTTTFLLGVFSTEYLVGVYKVLRTLTDLIEMALRVLSTIFYPLINRKKHIFSIYKKISVFVFFILAIGLLLTSNWALEFLKVEYEYSFILIVLLLFGVLGIGLYYTYGKNYLSVLLQDKILMYYSVIASISATVLSFPLIYYFNIFGAVLSIVFGRLLLGSLVFSKYLKDKKG